ncbi:MAG: hypothetical protein ACREN6_00655 [Gemmatimonadaceae bacterium]
MEWSQVQRDQLAREYVRVGYVPGEHWPAPPPQLSPEELLQLFARISDGAGRQGYTDALKDLEQI